MNPVYLHLVVNHVSLFAVLFGSAALLWAILKNSKEMRLAAIALFVIAGIATWAAIETGESAEEIAEHLPSVTESHIEAHEEAADSAGISVGILAVLSIALAVIERFKKQHLKTASLLVLVVALVSLALLGRTANLGGQIRHTEIRQ